MELNKLVKDYQNMVIYRQAMILLLAAPVPAAVVKLQGLLLNEQTIGLIMIAGNIFVMASHYINKFTNWKQLMLVSNAISATTSFGLLVGFMVGVEDKILVISFPIVMGLSFMLISLSSNKIKNIIKDKVGKDFDLGVYESKKASVTAFAAIVGQVLAIAFYTVVDINPMLVLVTLEVTKTVLFVVMEVQRYLLVCKIEKL